MKKILVIACVLAGVGFLAFSYLCACAPFSPAVRVQSDLQAMQTQLEAYKASNGTYPTTQQRLAALVVEPTSSPIPSHWTPLFRAVPKDPWQNEYVYRQPGRGQSKYDIFSAGPDHIPDTADDQRRK
jgi:general secretion pathway protein G